MNELDNTCVWVNCDNITGDRWCTLFKRCKCKDYIEKDNMTKDKVLIIYLATNKYARMYDKFYNTLPKFLPNTEKDVAVYTNLSKKEFLEINANRYVNQEDCHINYKYFKHILHMPWPIVALEKFNVILDAIKDYGKDYTHIYMFDSSVEFVQEVPERIYKTDKIIGALFYGWDKVNHNCKLVDGTEKHSYGYTNCDNYPYVCSGTIAGPINKIKKLCETCMEWMALDLKNHFIPLHDDESYFVRYFTELPEDEKTIVPANFDWAIDDDWFPGYRLENIYIQSQDDDDLMAEKFLENKEKPTLPIDMDKIPDKELKSFDQLMKELEL